MSCKVNPEKEQKSNLLYMKSLSDVSGVQQKPHPFSIYLFSHLLQNFASYFTDINKKILQNFQQGLRLRLKFIILIPLENLKYLPKKP